MLRLLFVSLVVLSCIIQTQDAMFTNGRSIQEVRWSLECLNTSSIYATVRRRQVMDDMIEKAMTKVSKKLQAKLDVLKDNKYALKLWKMYKRYYNKNYSSPDEEKERLGKFIDNLKLIVQENFRFDEGNKTFKMQLNQFGDMSLEEFRKKLTGLNEDGQGEKPPGEVIDQPSSLRVKRFLLDSIKKKVKDKIRKKLTPGSKRPSGSGMYYQPGYNPSSPRLMPTAKRPVSRLASRGTVDYRQYMNPIENQGRCGSVSCSDEPCSIDVLLSVRVTPLLWQLRSKGHMLSKRETELNYPNSNWSIVRRVMAVQAVT